MKNGLVAGSIVLALLVGVLVVFLPKERNDGHTSATSGVTTSPPVSHAIAITSTTNTLTQPTEAENAEAPTQLPRYQHPLRDAQRAALIREALIAQKAHKLAAAPTAAATNMPEREGSGNQVGKPMGNYVNRIMQEQFIPMATECYGNLLAQHPTVAGNVELAFSVLGDTSVGGVVVDVSLGSATTLTDPEFRTCMTESMFAVVFDAPPGEDGSVTVTQSLELAP